MKTILLVDSNSDNLENFTEYFETEGFNILAARDGHRAVKMAGDYMPDLIISEIMMSELTGYDLLSWLLQTPETCGIPFIFCTTKCEAGDRSMALKLGADDYIIKPTCMERLCEMARKWIESGSSRIFFKGPETLAASPLLFMC
jgi:CheY-like chemotaxis protein